MPKTTEAGLKARAKYDKENTTTVTLKLNHKTDAELVEKLLQQDNKQGYMKRLIKEDIKRATE